MSADRTFDDFDTRLRDAREYLGTVGRRAMYGAPAPMTVEAPKPKPAVDPAAISMTLNDADAKSLGKVGEVVTSRLSLANFNEFLRAR
jgi:hypothetical protein